MDMDKVWQNIGHWLGNEGLNILLIIVASAVIYYFCGTIIEWTMRKIAKGVRSKTPRGEIRKRQKTLASLFTTIVRVLIVLIALFTILQRDFGLNLAPLLASAGIAGVALGFGAQSIVKDSLTGFFIILENQYRVGDYIQITGTGVTDAHGAVEKVSIRSTTLRDRDGNVHFIPNGSIVQVTNKTLGYSKVHFSFTVETGTDVDKVTEIVNSAGADLAKNKEWKDKIIDPIHFSEVGKFSKDGFDVAVSGITTPADQWKVTSEYRRRLLAALGKENIKLV